MSSKAKVLYSVSKYLMGDSSYLEILCLNKNLRKELKPKLIGNILLEVDPEIDFRVHSKLHYISIPDEFKHVKY